MTNIIGIDPGVTGAIACLGIIDDLSCVPVVHKMPSTPLQISWLLANLIKTDSVIYMESVHSSPQMGVSTSFTFGENYGYLQGAVQNIVGLRRGFISVSPVVWQRAVGCLTGGDKKISRAKAEQVFPDTKGINLKTADALLIAYYGYLKERANVK